MPPAKGGLEGYNFNIRLLESLLGVATSTKRGLNMSSEKKTSITHFILFPAVAIGAILTCTNAFASCAISANSQVPVQILTPKEIIQSAKQALGGDDYFNPRPYIFSFSFSGYNHYESKTVNRTDTYKSRKYHLDARVSTKKGSSSSKYIINLEKNEAWETYSYRNNIWHRTDEINRPQVPIINKANLDNLIFDSETISIIKKNGQSYYQLNARYANRNMASYRRTMHINTTDNLIYKIEVIDTNGKYKQITTYKDYRNYQGIMLPQYYKTETTNRDGKKSVFEYTINDFSFRDDIPDSLFEVPDSSGLFTPEMPYEFFSTGTIANKQTEFYTSHTHPNWVSPEEGIVDRLKSDVVDIVTKFPHRNHINKKSLNQLADHIEGILKATTGRIERQEY